MPLKRHSTPAVAPRPPTACASALAADGKTKQNMLPFGEGPTALTRARRWGIMSVPVVLVRPFPVLKGTDNSVAVVAREGRPLVPQA